MKKFLLILVLCLIPVAGYYAFSLGWILVRTFIGSIAVILFILGIVIGRISKQ
jgi:VIT1/CCC1 family predicted Fe2+/Mn2+ transporter